MKRAMSYIIKIITLVIILGLLTLSLIIVIGKEQVGNSSNFWEGHVLGRVDRLVVPYAIVAFPIIHQENIEKNVT